MMMPKPSLFAEEERGNRRGKLDAPLVGLSKHVDFVALAAGIDTALPRPSRAKGGRPADQANIGDAKFANPFTQQ